MKYLNSEIADILKNIVIIVDTRDKKWEHIKAVFDDIGCKYIRRKLDFGDYSFEVESDKFKTDSKYRTYENEIVIERKNSLTELAGCFTTTRERFEDEFKRAVDMKSKFILLVENDDLECLRKEKYRSKLSSKSFEGSLWSWKHRYNYEVFFCKASEVGLYIYNIFYYYLMEKLKNENVEVVILRKELFSKELEYIKNKNIKSLVEVALDNAPEYFFEIAASTTGKYHPAYSLGRGGLARHTMAVARFANHLLNLEQYRNKFDEKTRDLIIAACILHDIKKLGDNGSKFTVFDHPVIAADWVVKDELFKDILPLEDRELIGECIKSHMGQWNTDKRSKLVLDKPISDIQQFVHMCDYLASRKDVEVLFDGVQQTESREEVKIEDCRFNFGRHNGKLITEVAKIDLDYLKWVKNAESMREPYKTFATQLVNEAS